jgi:glycerol-3-phosphate acyltransferase PlsY
MNELGFIPVTLIPTIWIVAAYLLGSIAFGILVSKAFGLPDPRTVGSGNIGATNVARSGKKSAAILTLLTLVWLCFLAIYTPFIINLKAAKVWLRPWV